MSFKGRVSSSPGLAITKHESQVKVRTSTGNTGAGSSSTPLLKKRGTGDSNGSLAKRHGSIATSTQHTISAHTSSSQLLKTRAPAQEGFQSLLDLHNITTSAST